MKQSTRVINIISIVIPIVVAILLGIPQKLDLGAWTKVLPHLNAVINSITSILLISALIAIKNKNIGLHQTFMRFAFILGACFLVFYVIYHLTNPSTKFLGEGGIRYVYFFILISHILLSLIVLPFVLLFIFSIGINTRIFLSFFVFIFFLKHLEKVRISTQYEDFDPELKKVALGTFVLSLLFFISFTIEF